MCESAKFSPRELLDAFRKAKQDNQIIIDEYVRGYTELTHFFEVLGSVFAYINSDVVEKVNILRYYRDGESSENYRTVQSMMEYEIPLNFSVSMEQPSGSRTLLRLHRALAFASLFMKRLGESHRADKSSTLAYDSYHETLAQFHPWLIRKGVGVATYALGSCGSLLDKCLGDTDNLEEAQAMLGDIAKAMDEVYCETESLYTKYDLHGLP